MKTLSRVWLSVSLAAACYQAPSAFAQIPRFVAPAPYSVPGASMAVVADVNSDGILDIVTANGFVFTGSGVSVLLGNGDGTFQPARTVVSGGNPSWVAVGDFNHDGHADIAVANEPDPNFPLTPATVGGPAHNSVSILLGNGDGTFQPSIDTPTLGALRLAVADFNGDGKLDLAVATGTSSPVQILLGNGDGTFVVSSTTVNSVDGRLLVADFNHDSKLDLLTSGSELLGNGDGTFTLGPPIPGAWIAGDFNGDGLTDLAAVISNGGGRNPVTLSGETFFGISGGTWGTSVFSNFTALTNIVAADFDGDGKLDIYGPGSPFVTPANQLIGGLFLGHGDGTFTQAAAGFGFVGYTSSGYPFPVFAAIGDLDRNGSPDVVTANGNGITISLNTFGHPPLLAQIATNAGYVVGGTNTVTGTVSLGGPAPAGGSTVAISSNNAAAFFSAGSTVVIPAGVQKANFTILTRPVTATTPVTLSATLRNVTQKAQLTVVPSFAVSSIAVSPSSLFGMFGGNSAVGTVTLSGVASDGVVITLVSSSSAASVPSSVAITPGSKSATFAVRTGYVAADTPVSISGSYQGNTQSGALTVRKELATVTVTKAEYTVVKSQLNVEATSTDRVASLQVFNSSSGALIGSIPSVGGGKFAGQFIVAGPLTSVAVQSSVGGLSIATAAQK